MKSALLKIAFACLAAAPLFAEETKPAFTIKLESKVKSAPTIEIESKVIEVPNSMAAALPAVGPYSFMDKIPGKAVLPSQWPINDVLDEKDTEHFLSALHGKEGVEIHSAPRITTRLANRDMVEFIREFRYPTAWTPPDQKEKLWTPTDFGNSNIGFTMDVLPTFEKDGRIDLKVKPAVTEFVGYVDAETREQIFAARPDPTKTLTEGSLASFLSFKQPNRPAKPIFSVLKTIAELTVNPGESVVLRLSETGSIEPFQAVRPGCQTLVLGPGEHHSGATQFERGCQQVRSTRLLDFQSLRHSFSGCG
jgi:hypothetical protein